MIDKERLFEYCTELLNQKIQVHQRTLTDLKESASNETRSTAGDKHETALAMLQIEQKNTSLQLDHLLIQKSTLERIKPSGVSSQVANGTPERSQVANGTLVKTTQGNFYISIPLGKITFEKQKLVALSAESPLGSKLMGLTVGEGFSFNSVNYIIQRIK
ncbi:MAG: hypothetical protein ABI151_00675 [Chitinophagaceae bacterium]